MALDLPALIRNGVAIAERVAGSLRVGTNPAKTVLHTPVTGRTATGPIYGTPVEVLAVVEPANETVVSADGTERLSAATFTFLEEFLIQENDRLTVNGVTTKVIKVGGTPLDPDTGLPYLTIAWTGK